MLDGGEKKEEEGTCLLGEEEGELEAGRGRWQKKETNIGDRGGKTEEEGRRRDGGKYFLHYFRDKAEQGGLGGKMQAKRCC